jgi:glutathione synthase/RimK-type ligase-like ATP-grasp enzyme
MNMRGLAIKTQQLYHYPRESGNNGKIRLLAILGPGDLMANSPVEFLIEGSQINLDLVFVTPELGLPEQLPEHDVVYVAVAESDENQFLLAQLEQQLQAWPVPVINRPGHIAHLSRDSACALLSNLPGISMPPTVRMPRSMLEQQPEQLHQSDTILRNQLGGAGFPIIIRPIDSHAGQDLLKIDDAAGLANYLANSSESVFFVSPFVDYRSTDGQFRKYRIILINGKPYACHMAISGRWMVHYLNADMLDNADNRDQEALFMEKFTHDFAARHATAMAAISAQLELEYVGIDCGETPDGQLLIFEVDSNMVVHNLDSPIKFPYKQGAIRTLFGAFATMVEQKITAQQG